MGEDLKDIQDIDALGTKVIASNHADMPHLGRIIMYNEKGEIWAAVSQDEIDGDYIIYYTNTDRFKKELPKTIQKWKATLTDYKNYKDRYMTP